MEELCDGKAKPKAEDVCLEDNVQTDLQGPPLLLSEFEVALKELKNGKTEGIDRIPAELLKALGSRGKRARPDSLLRLWRYINHLLTYLLTYKNCSRFVVRYTIAGNGQLTFWNQ